MGVASLWMNRDEGRKKQEEPTLKKLYRRFVIPELATALALGFFAFQALSAHYGQRQGAPVGDVRLAHATTF
jgi:hypothetical protein